MASKQQQQDELLSFIDSIMACIEQYPTFNLETPFVDANVGVNAMSLLLKLLGKFFTEEELIEWLAKFLTKTLPVLELGVKGVILSNLKLSLSCNVDPWIPDEWRQQPNRISKEGYHDGQEVTRIAIPMIDYRGMLQINPMSKNGQQYYNKTKIEYVHENPSARMLTRKVGTNFNEVYSWVLNRSKDPVAGYLYSKEYITSTGDLSSMYELARADDMNAFLWFVINKGIYGEPITEDVSSGKKNQIEFSTEQPNNISEENIKSEDVNQYSVYLSGDLVTTKEGDKKSKNYLICYDGQRTFTDAEFNYYSKLVPCSNKENSYNWYVNRKNYMKTALGKKIERDYKDEFPLCNIACVDSVGNPASNGNENYIQVQVLPKPMLHYHRLFWMVEKNQTPTPIPFIKILFNSKGEQDKKGRFTVCPFKDEYGKIASPYKDGKVKYDLIYPWSKNEKNGYILEINDSSYEIKRKDGGSVDIKKMINACLIACYPGLTVYEFNYDFVMGMRLFDPKTIAFRIIQTLTSFRLGADASLSMTETLYQMRISEIIKNMIDADDYEVSDCFFSFSNDKYQSMLDEAEQRRSHKYPFQNGEHSVSINGNEIVDILDKYSSTATLNEQKDVFKRAFMQASANITKEILPEDKLDFSKNFIMEAIKVLAVAIFETLISPKMLLLFEVNKRLMGEFETEYPDLEKILKELANLITAIIAELMQTIISELLSFLMSKLGVLLAKLASMITLEQLTFYKELIMKLIKACSFQFPLFGHRTNLDTQLDVVQYADIDEVDKPNVDEC